MKLQLVAVALVCVSHAALADAANSSAGGSNGNGPVALNTPFTIWADEGAKGKAHTPMHMLMEQARPGSLPSSPTTQAQQATPRQP